MHVQHLLYIFDIVPFRDFVDLIVCVHKDTLDSIKKNVFSLEQTLSCLWFRTVLMQAGGWEKSEEGKVSSLITL